MPAGQRFSWCVQEGHATCEGADICPHAVINLGQLPLPHHHTQKSPNPELSSNAQHFRGPPGPACNRTMTISTQGTSRAKLGRLLCFILETTETHHLSAVPENSLCRAKVQQGNASCFRGICPNQMQRQALVLSQRFSCGLSGPGHPAIEVHTEVPHQHKTTELLHVPFLIPALPL